MGSYATNTSWLAATTTTQVHTIIGLSSADIATSTVNSLITRREAFVSSFLASRYTLPLSSCTLVTSLVEDLVTYDIWKLLVGRDGTIDQSIQDQYNVAINVLTRISNGKQAIVNDSGTVVSEANASTRCYVNNKGYTATFNVDDPLNWRVSRKRLDDIATDRDADDV